MDIRRGSLMAAAAFWLLSGCAGTNFERASSTNFVPGQTSQKDITQRMGEPYKSTTVVKNGKTLQNASYAYSKVNGDGLYPGVTPARVQGFYFLDGILVGTE